MEAYVSIHSDHWRRCLLMLWSTLLTRYRKQQLFNVLNNNNNNKQGNWEGNRLRFSGVFASLHALAKRIIWFTALYHIRFGTGKLNKIPKHTNITSLGIHMVVVPFNNRLCFLLIVAVGRTNKASLVFSVCYDLLVFMFVLDVDLSPSILLNEFFFIHHLLLSVFSLTIPLAFIL